MCCGPTGSGRQAAHITAYPSAVLCGQLLHVPARSLTWGPQLSVETSAGSGLSLQEGQEPAGCWGSSRDTRTQAAVGGADAPASRVILTRCACSDGAVLLVPKLAGPVLEILERTAGLLCTRGLVWKTPGRAMEHLWCAPFLRPHLLLLVARWNTSTRWSTRPSISSLARGEYWRRKPGGEGLWGAACGWGGPYSLRDTHTLILSQAGQAALLGAGRWGERGHWLQDPPGGGGPRGELSWVRGRCWQCLLGSAPELCLPTVPVAG